MKKTHIYFISLTLLTLFFNACKTGCPLEYAGIPPNPIVLQIRDNQDRDLLDPATPGHYDTTVIKTLNTGKVEVRGVGKRYGVSDTTRIRLAMYINNHNPVYNLRLSAIETDEIKTTFENVSKCTTTEWFKAITYNGVSYPTGHTSYYTIKKNVN